ncbi:unnamed protein product [Protopolystoma xenopodis]|uniref:Uncharacterized protein n=1 Tax=Protopolystoma xenopodis TaxID=117903 RepID=A0A448WK53_9PLAT|nr:unnamed protein product [Protopolystoma xenopodis]
MHGLSLSGNKRNLVTMEFSTGVQLVYLPVHWIRHRLVAGFTRLPHPASPLAFKPSQFCSLQRQNGFRGERYIPLYCRHNNGSCINLGG